ncbi:hypothetical protein WJX72_004802 [[Myrmecia] bisecta]|uniref:Uncharacterized protein n=1 Tax=[Myrmecia] bisecta TaxID=41462 RepID=A0AAW1Q457_9CHLO
MFGLRNQRLNDAASPPVSRGVSNDFTLAASPSITADMLSPVSRATWKMAALEAEVQQLQAELDKQGSPLKGNTARTLSMLSGQQLARMAATAAIADTERECSSLQQQRASLQQHLALCQAALQAEPLPKHGRLSPDKRGRTSPDKQSRASPDLPHAALQADDHHRSSAQQTEQPGSVATPMQTDAAVLADTS